MKFSINLINIYSSKKTQDTQANAKSTQNAQFNNNK